MRPELSDEVLCHEPLAQAKTIPSRWYTAPEVYEWDNNAIMASTWQLVGHLGQLQTPGDVLKATVAENPVMVVRTEAGLLKGFYNVCRHRGGPLLKENGTGCKQFRCNYHSWTYDLDGTLKGIPEFEGVENFEPEAFGLRPVQVETWENLVFINLNENPTPLATVFEGISDRILPIDLQALTFYGQVRYTLACNWKVYVDNYAEGYHINQVHPELAQLVDYKQYTTELSPWYSLQHSPLRADDNVYGIGVGEIFYYFVFPNLMLNIMPNRLQVNLIVPLSHDRTEVIFDYFYRDITSEAAQKLIREDWAYSELVQQQDIDICERVQQGLASRAYDQGRLSVKRESGVHHFQNLLKTAYRQERDRLQTETDPRMQCTV